MKTVACLALLAMIGFGSDGFQRESPRQAKDPLEGKPAPALQVQNWVGANADAMTWDKLRGKVVVLDFWGTWCGPCVAAVPKLKDLQAKYGKDGLVIIGVHTTSGAEKMADFAKKESLPYAVAADVQNGTVTAYGVDSYPDYYLIDRKGVLRFADLANAELERAIQHLLKE
ncbi:MAG: TlpA family protein disulfide reductase [Fimbriimonadaceae bacterium]